mgnify:CR=1 FL=1
MDKNKRIITVLMILTIVFTIMGGTFAYWSWRTTDAQKTNITFSITSDFSCAADGGGNITSNDVNLVPTVVSDKTTANYIKREVKVTPTINTTGKTVYMDLWLDVKTLGSGLSGTDYFKYSFTTGVSSPDDGVVYSGNFRGLVKNNRVRLLLDKEYTSSMTDTYYLWIWLDAAETDSATMNQSFHLVLNGSCTDTKIEPNAPVLDDGMIPIVFDTSNGTVIKTISSTDSSWYDYSYQEWANAVLVKESGTQTRAYYKANPGVTVNESDILAYYVWIPRYSYKIWSVDNDNKNGKEQTIDIQFESTDTISTGTIVGSYITHPAFWWDNDSDGVREEGEELAGIWVGKFETTGTASNPTILPDAISLTHQNVSTQFATAQLLGGTTYGISSSSDSHMMKNNEWGAVAYLSHSKYGVNREVYINNSAYYYTGRSGGNYGGMTPIKKTYTDQISTDLYNWYGYYTWDGYLLNYNTNTKSSTRDLTKVASTTGNITGIYDMSGGAYEYVMGVFANSDGQLWSGYTESRNSGFTGLLGSLGTSCTGTAFPDSKYYDVYKASSGTTISALTACNGGVCYGHGLSEVSYWYKDNLYFVNAVNPWFLRGGYYLNGALAGAFGFYHDVGGASVINGFRSSLVVDGA